MTLKDLKTDLRDHKDAVVGFLASERDAAGVAWGDDRYLSDIWQMTSPCHAAPVMPRRIENPPGPNWYDKFEMACRTCGKRTPAAYWYEDAKENEA